MLKFVRVLTLSYRLWITDFSDVCADVRYSLRKRLALQPVRVERAVK